MSMGEGSNESLEEEISSLPEWDSLPLPCLVQIFDDLLRAPTPHPSYLSGKLKSWSALFRTCTHWKRAIIETGVGVCLPKELEPKLMDFLKRARIRGLELHDPDHTDDSVISLLGDKDFLASSASSMQSIVDVPFSPNGPWNPKDFTNLSHLTIRDPHHQGPMPTAPVSTPFDCTAVAGMKNLRVLVLAAGFNEVTHLSSLPTTCQQMMINCPGQPQCSHLSITEWPTSNFSLEWLSISTHTLQIDFEALKGSVKQLHVHAAFLFLESGKSQEAAKAKVRGVAENLLYDSNLMEAQLTCEVVVVGSRPHDPSVNTMMLTGSPMVDILQYYSEVSNNEVEGSLLSVYSAFLAEREQAPGGDRVQLDVAQYGPELEVTIVRQKEGEKGSLALRLDAIGINPEEEVEKLTMELREELQGSRGRKSHGYSALGPDSFICTPPSSTTYRSVTFPRWVFEECGDVDGNLEERFYDACEDLSFSLTPPKAPDSEFFQDCEAGPSDRPSPFSTSSANASFKAGRQLSVSSHLRLSTRLLTSSSFLESSRDFLTEVNGLLIPPHSIRPYCPTTNVLLSPYFALTALFCTTLGDRNDLPLLPESCFPTTLQELYLTAGMKGQNFPSSSIENLVELRRLNLRGYASFDLGTIPALRPGLCLVISDMDVATRASLSPPKPTLGPPRAAPVGSKEVDVVIPSGKIIEVSVNITLSDPTPQGAGGPSEAQRRGGGVLIPPPSTPPRGKRAKDTTRALDIDLDAWLSVAHSLHAQALSGVNLHAASCTSLSALMARLISDGMDHMVVVTTVFMPANQLLAVPGYCNFKIILDDGKKIVDGLELLFAISQNSILGWEVQWNFEGQDFQDELEGDNFPGEEGEGGEGPDVAGAGAGPFAGVEMGHAVEAFLAHQAAQGHPPPDAHQVQAALQVLQAIQAANPAAVMGELRSRVICIAFYRGHAGANA